MYPEQVTGADKHKRDKYLLTVGNSFIVAFELRCFAQNNTYMKFVRMGMMALALLVTAGTFAQNKKPLSKQEVAEQDARKKDKEDAEHMGPGGQTIFFTAKSEYYYFDKNGKKVVCKKEGLKKRH